MKKYCYAIGLSLLMASCAGENKQNESTEAQETPPKQESVVGETLETIENTVEELNNETEELNNDLDSLINTI